MTLNADVLAALKWNAQGLIPAIVQDAETRDVLMMAYMNAASLMRTLELGQAVFWSRSRGELWRKGATRAIRSVFWTSASIAMPIRSCCWSSRLVPLAIR